MKRAIGLAIAILASLLFPSSEAAGSHSEDAHSRNVQKKSGAVIESPEGAAPGTRLAFQGRLILAGGPDGLGIFRRGDSNQLKQLSFFECTLGSGNVSIWKRHAILSAASGGSQSSCPNPETTGLRIVDIRKAAKPRQVAAIELPCGSATHTLYPGRKNLYVLSLPAAPGLGGCGLSGEGIAVVRIPNAKPRRARVIGSIPIAPATRCSEIVLYPEAKLMAGACGSTSLLWRLTRKVLKPSLLAEVDDSQIQNHATVSFTWDARLLLVGDSPEAAGGLYLDGCSGDPSSTVGALWVVDIQNRSEPVVRSHIAPGRRPTYDDLSELTRMRCSTHAITTIPTRDRGIRLAVVSHLAGGLSIVNMSDPDAPQEIGFYVDTVDTQDPDQWSAAWFNGLVHATQRDSLHGLGSFSIAGVDRRSAHYFRTRYNPQLMLRQFECSSAAVAYQICSGYSLQRRAH